MTAERTGATPADARQPGTAALVTDPAGGIACMACGHSGAEHDRIAQRFCDATVEHALTRGCICGAAPKARPVR